MAAPTGVPWPRFRAASDLAWRFLVVASAIAVVVFVLVQIRLVVLPLFISLLLATVLVPIVVALERRGLRPLLATWIVFLGLLLAAVVLISLIVPRLADEFAGLATIVSDGIDDVEDWLVEGPLDLSREEVDDYRTQAGERIGDYLQSSA